MLRNSIINLVLKAGLCISLLLAALAAFVVPSQAVRYWPSFISNQVSEQSLGLFTGLAALALIVWLLSGRNKFSSALTTGILVTLCAIINIGTRATFVFSLIPLISISAALALRYYPRIRVVMQTRVTPLTGITLIAEESGYSDQGADVTDYSDSAEQGISESNIHVDHAQHLFIKKQ